MGYQVLARKWRPKSFKEMVGQEHVLQTLINALDNDRLHHAYLFTGTRGVGKTTIARILSKCLNCEKGITSEPCGECGTCKEIDEGRFVDLIEVDAASRTKVEDTRELLENVQYAPTRGRYKVYLIDEVHMLSTHSFNALLKTLEEPPPHVKFLLATTDPQKLPVTILSRCLQFSLKNMPPQRIVEHLSRILNSEDIEFDESALWEIGRAADGSVRDAMSLTDQAIAFGDGQLSLADVRSMLGTIDRTHVFSLIEALAANDAEKMLQVIESASEFAPDYMGILGELISTLHRIAIAQAVPNSVDNSLGDAEKIQHLAEQITAEDLQLYYQTALVGRKDLPLNPDARAGLEMVLLRMLLFRPLGSPTTSSSTSGSATGQQSNKQQDRGSSFSHSNKSASAERTYAGVNPIADKETKINSIESSKGQGGTGRAKVLAAKALLADERSRTPKKVEAKTVSAAPAACDSKALQPPNQVSVPGQNDNRGDQAVASINADQVSVTRLAKPAGTSKAAVDGDEFAIDDPWSLLIERLGVDGNVLNMARNCSLEAKQNNHYTFHLDARHEVLLNNERIKKLENAIATTLQSGVSISVHLATPSKKTPDQLAEEVREKKLIAATTIINSDPVVTSLKKQFQAVIDPNSIRPKL